MLQLLHLPEFQLHRRGTAEDRHCYLEPRTGVVDLFDGAVEGGERAIRHAHLLAHLERDRRLWPFDPLLHLVHDALGFGIRDRQWLVIGADKAGDLRGVLDQVVGLVGEVHLHQHVAGKEFPLGIDLAAAADFHDLLLRHHDLFEERVEMALLGLFADRIGNLLLEIRIGLDYVPALGHGPRFRLLIRSSAHPPIPSTNVTSIRITWSANKKKIEAIATITNTIAVVMAVSRRVGQVTLAASARTSCRNLNGLTFGIRSLVTGNKPPPHGSDRRPNGRDPTSSCGIAAPQTRRLPGRRARRLRYGAWPARSQAQIRSPG